ncbi:MAG: rod shape-determining protein RodA, partial [Planctomycetota bacterium]
MTITRPRFPWLLLICAAVLAALGLAAIARGDELAGGEYARRQFVWLVLSVPAAVCVQMVPYRRVQYFSGWLFLGCLVLLVAVYFMPPVNGARRWIPLGPVKFQPSEPAKLAYVCALAAYLRHRSAYRRLVGLLIPFAITLIPIGLILKEPDLGTALLFVPVLFAMLFAAGARVGHLALVVFCGVLCIPWLWHAMSGEQRSRVLAVLTQHDGGPVPRDDGYH